MFSSRKPVAGLAAGFTALVLGVGGMTVAASADTSDGQAKVTKPAPVIPMSATAAPRLQGTSAAATSKAGSPAARVQMLASQDGACDAGDLCLYYLFDHQGYGSGYDTAHNDPYLFNNRFIFSGSGQGATVGNNARAYWNRDPSAYAYVCTGTSSTGSCGWLAPNSYGNLNATYADRSQSMFWGDSSN